jgi:hypothetical protein
MSQSSNEFDSKPAVQESLKEVSPQYNVDGVEDDEGYQYNHEGVQVDGYTKKDKGDMTRMGKKQELTVKRESWSIATSSTDHLPEKFSTAFCAFIHRSATGYMGIPVDVSL